MSVSLYRWTEECEQDPTCVGDCDKCRKETMNDKYDEVGIPTMEIEADGFITRPEALERVSQKRAKPVEKCIYPRCEDCDKYHGHYCTVPMVISKQNYIIINDKIDDLTKRMLDLEDIVNYEILRSDKGITIPSETKLNFTWDDYLGEDQ